MSETMMRLLDVLRGRFAAPWRVGWWENGDGRCGVEVSRRAEGKHYERRYWAGAGWDEVAREVSSDPDGTHSREAA